MQTRLELYQLVVPLAGLGIWEKNLITGAVYWSSIVHQILETNPDEILDLEASLKFYKDPDRMRDMIDQVIGTGMSWSEEGEVVTAKGRTKWVKVQMQGRLENGKCVQIYGTLEDISEGVGLRHLMEERERRFSQAFDHAPIGMALVSLKGEWIKVNKSLLNLLGYKEEEFQRNTFQDYTHPDDLEADLKLVNQLLAGELETYSMEKRYFHSDRHIIWAFLSVSLIRDELGNPLYFISQIKDITERKRNAEVIRAQNSRLLNFAHIVSHNLRSHTGNIKMLTDMIEREQSETEKREQIGLLRLAASNLLETLSELNDIVRIHDNGLEHRKSLNLRAEIERVLGILAAYISEAEAIVELTVADDITVRFNPAYVESIFVNLIGNCIKYRNPDRRLNIRIMASQTVEKTVVKIIDNGLGIDLSLHGHKLFGMYKTFHGNPDARGMGLFLAKNQVEAMGGRIYAESRPGEGATFFIEINKE